MQTEHDKLLAQDRRRRNYREACDDPIAATVMRAIDRYANHTSKLNEPDMALIAIQAALVIRERMKR